jgi:hypothetical protein
VFRNVTMLVQVALMQTALPPIFGVSPLSPCQFVALGHGSPLVLSRPPQSDLAEDMFVKSKLFSP